jgi:predicted nucleic acid-binding protein
VRFLIDTNVLVLGTVEECDGHEVASTFIQKAIAVKADFCLSWVNVYEYLRIVTHPGILKQPLAFPVAHGQIERLLSRPFVTFDNHFRRFPGLKVLAPQDAGHLLR